MKALETRIPPLLVAAVLALVMGLLSFAWPPWPAPDAVRLAVAGLFAAVAGAFDIAALVAFRRARTTPNPMKPQKASALVVGGVYRITRNPMYVGMLLWLLAWAVFLALPWALAGPVAFVAFMNRFQIGPEERVLAARFGQSYETYRASVRRWL